MKVSKDIINRIDQSGMFDILTSFSEQIDVGLEAGNKLERQVYDFNKIIIAGMGGSAISGDLLRSYLNAIGFKIPIYINRDYNIPNWTDGKTLFIASSYSGNTEETLSAYSKANEITNNIICITTGGEIENLAKQREHQCIKIEPGMMPRCALGMSFFGLLSGLRELKIIRDDLNEDLDQAIVEVKRSLNTSKEIFCEYDSNNEALNLARLLYNKTTVIYTGEVFTPIGLRWKGQLNENAKAHAFTGIIPEMNHNEINSWDYELRNRDFRIVVLNDRAEHPKVQKRSKILTNLFEGKANISSYSSDADSLLARMFEVIYFGDWVSYYLALMREIDPTPIPTISKLKNLMQK